MASRRVFTTAICAILACSTVSTAALGQTAPAADIAMTGNGEGSLPSFSETTADPSQGASYFDAGIDQSCCPRWTASADAIILQRIGTFNQTLVTTYPGAPSPTAHFVVGQGTDQLLSGDLTQGFAAGSKIGLIQHGDDGYDLEFSFFEVEGWKNAQSVSSGTDTTPVFVAPGGFVQTTDSATQYMQWEYATRLYNAEINVRWDLCPRVTMLAGFRWANVSEQLQGTLPPQRAVPFWNTETKNNLYGFQIGAEGKLLERGRFSLGCVVKAGLSGNHAEETTTVSIYRILFQETASTDHAAFVGDIGVQCKYQVTQRLSFRAGYQAIWLQGIALAPAQIPETYSHIAILPQDIYVQALGVNSGSGVFYHGATAGLEYSF
jgi:hypothetical protein